MGAPAEEGWRSPRRLPYTKRGLGSIAIEALFPRPLAGVEVMSALAWPILLLAAGLILLIAEVFIPSGGAIGLLAIGIAAAIAEMLAAPPRPARAATRLR